MGNWLRRNEQQTMEIEEQNQLAPSKCEVKFRSGVTKREIEKALERKDLSHLTENQTWCLDFDKEELHYPHLLSLLESCSGVITLYVNYQSDSMFLIHLTPIKFPHLKKISLSHCKIQSLEKVQKICFPSVEEMCLSQNNISSIRPLRKILPRLKILNLRENCIQTLAPLSEVNFDDEAAALNLEESGLKYYYGDNISWMFKMNFQSISRFCNLWYSVEVDGKDRIPSDRIIMKMLKQKYKSETTNTFYWGPKLRSIQRL